MSSTPPDGPPNGPRLSLPPPRVYELPGGPFASGLGKVDVFILAEFKRGSARNSGTGGKR